MKKYLNALLSIGLVIIAVGGLFVWDFYLDKRLNTKEVVVAVRTLDKNSILTKEDLKFERLRIEQIPDSAITNPNEVIGRETAFVISKGLPLVTYLIDFEGVVPNDNQLIVPIPKDWVVSVPGSLRRKDKVNLFEIPNKDIKDLNYKLSKNPLLSDIVVAYAKDSSNQEVKPTKNDQLRIDATGIISDLELVLTYDQLDMLKSKALEGYKYLIAYK